MTDSDEIKSDVAVTALLRLFKSKTEISEDDLHGFGVLIESIPAEKDSFAQKQIEFLVTMCIFAEPVNEASLDEFTDGILKGLEVLDELLAKGL